MLAAGGTGAVAGILIATPGAGGMGASMAGNLVADHMSNILKGENFSAEQHAFSGAVGASVGLVTGGVGSFLDKVPLASGKIANFALGIGSKGVVSGVMDTLGDPDLLSGKAPPSVGRLAGNIGFNLLGEGFGELAGVAGRFASRSLWSYEQAQLWDGLMTSAWKYLETAARYVSDEASSDQP